MNLYIMRHGQAQLHAQTDAKRQLTDVGIQEASAMAEWANQQRFSMSHIIVSPYIRAQQTASTFIETFSSSLIKDVSPHFEPTANVKHAHDYIDAVLSLNKVDGLLIVSHMPLVSYLVNELTLGQSAPLFQTASIAVIDYDVDRMSGQVIAMKSPMELG